MWASVVSYLTEFEMNCKPFLFLKVYLGFCTGLSTHNIVLCTWLESQVFLSFSITLFTGLMLHVQIKGRIGVLKNAFDTYPLLLRLFKKVGCGHHSFLTLGVGSGWGDSNVTKICWAVARDILGGLT